VDPAPGIADQVPVGNQSVGQDRSPANGLRKSGCRDDYNVIAISMTHVNPTFIARSVARIALSTEAQPLMPQAQGTSPGAQAEMRDRPSGNGIQNAMAIFGASAEAEPNEFPSSSPRLFLSSGRILN